MSGVSGEGDAGAALVVRSLGGLTIEVGGERIEARVPAKAAAIIAYLADVGGSATRSRLAGLLWSDQEEERARANLRVALTRLRREIGGCLESDRRSVRLIGAVDHDATRIVDAGPAVVADLYRGDFLAGVEFDDASLFDDWSAGRRSQLRHLAVESLVEAAVDAESTGNWAVGVRCADRAIEIEPTDERAHRAAVRAALRLEGRSAALARHRACVEVIERELGLDPEPDTLELAREIESGAAGGTLDRSLLEADLDSGSPTERLVVPPTPFFGREDELSRIEALVADGSRVVTLVGSGGAGKTRLAERAADRLRGLLDRQIAVALHGVSDGDRVASIVSSMCGAPPGSTDPVADLVDHLGAAPHLLVIDNADEVADAVGELLIHLAARCDGLVALVTSRVALGVSVEHVVPIDGLDHREVQSGAEVSAPVALFVERARRFAPDVIADADVRAICERVGGLPLAIELAARWAGVLSPASIAERLAEGVDLLETDARDVPERQRSMQRVLDLTWSELGQRERDHMARLSVFRGGFDLAAAEAVAGANPSDLQHLASRSLLRRVPGGRFAVHELIRQHASTALSDPGVVADRHATHVLARVADSVGDLRGGGSARAVERLTDDFDNVVAAWNHVVAAGMVDRLVAVAPPMVTYSIAATRDVEVTELLRRAADRSTGADRGCMLAHQLAVSWRRLPLAASTELYEVACAALEDGTASDGIDQANDRVRWRALAANIHATALTEQGGSPDEALAIVERALDGVRRIDDRELLAELALTAGRAEGVRGHFVASERLLGSAIEAFELLGDDCGGADAIALLAATYAEQYRVWDALQADRRALSMGLARRDEQLICTGHANLGSSMLLVGAWDEAHEHTAEAMRLVRLQRDRLFEAYLHCQLAEIAVARGDRALAESEFLTGVGGLRREHYRVGLRLKLPEWARFLVDDGRWVEAELVIDEALAVCDQLGGEHFVLTVDALRARCLFGSGRVDAAEQLAIDVWRRIRGESGGRLPDPIASMADCAAVFELLGDGGVVDEIRELARRRVRDVVSTFDEPRYRQTYLAIPVVSGFVSAPAVIGDR